ncbi:hypothetical protein SNOG_02145 [Parastagonospora nodorum SN15]|uniref:Uncharacterized protein n=1 Tax=Phaeosphaeria nodorum (strain SN15 / ATCC MYA-4574 / FGSC 10173) TaxID=321614 RepID=Q0V1G9_PHANO|nr:hypothetical protein SNOG_02145 [Parastagonospora nodorum SN15]EAT90357.2 hypothetical protein SNOG_02145 [Parastagonospora nodorum SN15]
MQGEVIKSLQMAAQYDNAVLNLAVLHEASITNKTATFLILDQLKQRALPSHRVTDHLPRSLGTTAFDPSSFASDAYVSTGRHAFPHNKREEILKHGLTNYFLKRNNSVQKSSKQPKTPDDINFSQAFQHLMNARGGEDRAAIMREIDEITDLYQDLSVNQRPKNAPVNIPWPSDTEGRRDTLFTLHTGGGYSCDRNAIQSQSPTSTSPTITSLRQTSIAPSIASTDSSNSTSLGILPGSRMSSLRSATIQSGPAGQERMMSGRPCKANNYWGFCKGAWTIREDVKKGLAIRTQPLGMYNHKDIWECVACTFKGTVFSAPHPTKKNKEVNVVDPRVVLSLSGVRYKWVFLAKSHIKKKAGDSHSEESNYGCVFCCLEDRVSSVYGGVETLMNHIALSHVADMSENVRRKAKCVVGRMPGEGEEWDINIPVFARVEELE